MESQTNMMDVIHIESDSDDDNFATYPIGFVHLVMRKLDEGSSAYYLRMRNEYGNLEEVSSYFFMLEDVKALLERNQVLMAYLYRDPPLEEIEVAEYHYRMLVGKRRNEELSRIFFEARGIKPLS